MSSTSTHETVADLCVSLQHMLLDKIRLFIVLDISVPLSLPTH